VIIVETGDYYPSWRDGRIEAIERGTTESGWGSSVLGRPVVKAFNNMTAQSLAEGARSKGAKKGIALPVAGDDARAKSIVIALLDDLGFDGVDAGGLDESWRQQPGTAVFGHPDCRQSIGALRDAARYGNPRAVEGRRPETPGTIHEGARRRGRIMSRLRSVALLLLDAFAHEASAGSLRTELMSGCDFAGQRRSTRAARLRVHAALLAWSTILLVVVWMVRGPDRRDQQASAAPPRLERKSGPGTPENRR
jgi:hypothetical protein